MDDNEKKAYALGIIASELGIDFDADNKPEEMAQLNALAEDAISEEPKSEMGKKMKVLIDEEKAKKDGESEYNKGFNFHKDLNNNKISPATVFICEVVAKYIERLINNDATAESEMMSEVVTKLNDLDYPNGYINQPFKMILGQIGKLNAALQGQVEHREDEIKALAIGVKHPEYKTLSPHLASLRTMDQSIKNLRETFKFTEDDYRSSK